MTAEGPVKGKPMYRINVVFQELGTPRRYEYDVNDTDLNHLKDVVGLWLDMLDTQDSPARQDGGPDPKGTDK